MNNEIVGDYQSKTHNIRLSRSHKDMWVFTHKTNGTFFAITAVHTWIKDNFYPTGTAGRPRTNFQESRTITIPMLRNKKKPLKRIYR